MYDYLHQYNINSAKNRQNFSNNNVLLINYEALNLLKYFVTTVTQ